MELLSQIHFCSFCLHYFFQGTTLGKLVFFHCNIHSLFENFVLKWRVWKEGFVFWGQKTRCTKMVDYNTGGIRWWKNSNLKVEVIHLFFFLSSGPEEISEPILLSPHTHLCSSCIYFPCFILLFSRFLFDAQVHYS